MQMSNQLRLFEIFESNKKRGATFGLVNEAIENVVPKNPTMLGRSNSLFLQEQFEEKYWPQAMRIRYIKLFDYLTYLSLLRKAVYKEIIKKEESHESSYWNDPRWKDWGKLAKDNKAMLQSDAKAKAIATKAFPAGYKINVPDAIAFFESIYGSLKQQDKDWVAEIAEIINKKFIENKYEWFVNLRVKKDKPKSFHAKAYIADLAKELEGPYGSPEGYDLNNPRRIEVYINDTEKESRFVTDSFVFPTLERLKAQINKHIVGISSKLVLPKDQAEQDELDNGEEHDSKLKQDEGLNQVAKQLFQIYFNRIMKREKTKKAKDKNYNIKKNMVRQEAKNELYKNLKDFSGEDIKATMQVFFPGVDVSKLNLPYQGTEVVQRSDNRRAIQNLSSGKVKKKTVTVRQIIDGKVVPKEVKNTILLQSELHKPVELIYKLDKKDLGEDTLVTNLTGTPLGNKYFDPIMFTRLLKRVEFLRTSKDAVAFDNVRSVLLKYGLSEKSTPQEIIDASQRYFYQTAKKEEYYQGGKTSATFSLHPTRMSAEAKFLHKGHQEKLFDNRVDVLLQKGVITNSRTRQTVPTLDFIKKYVSDFLQPSARDERPLKRLFLLRALDTINNLIELKVLENLGDDSMFINISKTKNPDEFIRPQGLIKLIKMELIRYLRQDFFTGSRRKAQDFILGLDADSESLSCKVSQRGWTPNMCFFGADIRTIKSAAVTAMNQIIADQDTADIEEEIQQRQSIINARAKVRYELEKFVTLFKILLKIYKTIEIKNKVSEDKALNIAGANLTEFVQQNALLSTSDFIDRWYAEFQRLEVLLVGSDPKAMELLQIPSELQGKSGSLVNLSTIQQRFSKKFNPEGLMEKIAKTNLDDKEIDEIANRYKFNSLKTPTEKDIYKQDVISKSNDTNKIKFLNAIAEHDKWIDSKIFEYNKPQELEKRFRNYLKADKIVPNFAMVQKSANSVIKYISGNNLYALLLEYMKNLFGRKKINYAIQQKKALTAVAKTIYKEILNRGDRADLLVYLGTTDEPELSMALSYLELHT
jgi:hypothetical protein